MSSFRFPALLTALLLFPVLAAGPAPAEAASADVTPTAWTPAIAAAVADVSLPQLYSWLYDLQNFTTRYAYSPNIVAASQYIYNEYAAMPGMQASFQNFTYGGAPMRNVLAVLPGLNPANRTIYIIGGHYDSTIQGGNPMTAAPGADDDGTGTVAAMEAARVLSRYRFNATLVFAAWTAEELGLVGSDVCARCYKGLGTDVGLYLNMDMIGYDPNGFNEVNIYYDGPSQWASDLFVAQLADYSINVATNPIFDPTAGGSDHYTFWAQGFPSIFLIETDFNSLNYHRTTDTVDKINMHFYTNVTKGAVATMASLAGIYDPSVGTVMLDRTAFGTNGSASLFLYDEDVNANPTVAETASVTFTSPLEPGGEALTLTETGTNTSIFRGAMPLGTTPGVPGELQVSPGDTITASYADASPPGIRTDAAVIDGAAPTVQNVRAKAGITRATITWETDEPTESLVSYGATPALGSSAQNPELATQHSLELTNLLQGTPYYFDVTATDAAGYVVTADNGGAHYAFHTYQGLETVTPASRVGYVRSDNPTGNFFGDRRILSGWSEVMARAYKGAGQFDTSTTPIPAPAKVNDAWIDLYENTWIYTEPGEWRVQVLNQSGDLGWTLHTYASLSAVPADYQVPPTLQNADFVPGSWRSMHVPAANLDSVKDRVNTGMLSFRIDGPTGPTMPDGSIFEWAAGQSPCTNAPPMAPRLSVVFSPTGDAEGPEVTSLLAIPNPTFAAASATVTATVSDLNTGNTPIATAEAFLGTDPGVGLATPMTPVDGGFNEVTEDVTLAFDVSALPRGIYPVGVRGQDVGGNWGPVRTYSLFVGDWDLVPPEIRVRDTPDPAALGAVVAVIANVTDNVGVSTVVLNMTRPDGTTAFNQTMPKPADDWVYAQSYAMLGTWGYTVWALDVNGNLNSSQGSFLMRDTVPPTIENVTASPDPAEYPAVVNITAKVTDDLGVASAAVNVTGPGGVWLTNDTMVWDGDNVSYERPYASLGSYAFRIWASDVNGNWASEVGGFVVRDTTPPVITGNTAVPNPAEIYASVNVSAVVTDLLLDTVTINVTIPGGGSYEAPMSYHAVSGRWYHVVSTDTLGAHPYLINAADTSGNTATEGGTFAVIDTTAPTVTAHPEPAVQALGGVVRIVATAQDNYDLASVEVTVWDPASTPVGPFDMTYDAISSTYYHDVTVSQLGTYSYNVSAADGMGNDAHAPGTFLSTDNMPPTIDNVTAEPPVATSGDETRLSARVHDNVAVTSVSFEVLDASSALVGNFTATYNATSGRWEHVSAFGVGDYTFHVWAFDAAGNFASASAFFAVEQPTVPPPAPDVTLWIILIVIVIILLLLLFVVWRRRKNAEKEPPKEENAEGPPGATEGEANTPPKEEPPT